MGGVEDCNWFDIVMDELGVALTTLDESIQKSTQLWTEFTTELTKNMNVVDLPTDEPNNGQSSQNKPVAEVKERQIQHWAMCLGEVKEEPIQHWAMCLGDVKEEPIQHWAMCLGEVKGERSQHWAMSASKVPESLIQEQKDDEYDDDDLHFDWNDVEDEDEVTVSKSCENMLGNLGTPGWCDFPPCHPLYSEDANETYMRRRDGYQVLKNDDTSSEDDDDDEVEKCYLGSVKEGMEWLREHKVMSDAHNESLVGHDDEDDVSDKLQGFVDVKEEEIVNTTESGEGETFFPESDWVYVTRDY